ncbi:CdaR family transcriptional regulator [Salinicoccus cyprini]|nr:sugar diacid recognition domain-containing protein [Salinicoccus cyprini]
MVITRKIAKEIVRETSNRLDRNINIMDTEGIIISSIDKKRLGSIHQGALEVLRTNQTLVIHSNEEWEGTQPGINLPIVFMEETIGVIGITGDPKEVGNIGELVKMTTELMIRQDYLDLQTEWKQHARDTLIDQLLKQAPSQSIIDQNQKLLGLKLDPPFTSLTVQMEERDISNRQIIEMVEKNINLNRSIIGFTNLNRLLITVNSEAGNNIDDEIEVIVNLFRENSITFRIGISLPFHTLADFNQAYKECEIALDIGNPNHQVIPFSKIEAKSIFYQVDQDIGERFSNRVLGNLDERQIDTLETFFRNDLNIQKTSDKNYMHRNSLIYRLNKIIEDTGYNPKVFEEALVLQVAIWIYRRSNR